jgi:hypothetical protein
LKKFEGLPRSFRETKGQKVKHEFLLLSREILKVMGLPQAKILAAVPSVIGREYIFKNFESK